MPFVLAGPTIFAARVNGIDFIDAPDPSGGNPPNPTVQLVYRGADGKLTESGFFLQLHSNQKMRGYVRAAASGAGTFFELETGTDHLVIAS